MSMHKVGVLEVAEAIDEGSMRHPMMVDGQDTGGTGERSLRAAVVRL